MLYLVSLNEMSALVQIKPTKCHRFTPEVQYSLIVLWYFPEGGKDFGRSRRNNGLINHRLLELQIRISNQLSKHVPTNLCGAFCSPRMSLSRNSFHTAHAEFFLSGFISIFLYCR